MKKNRHITAFYVETLLLILAFIAIILVLTNVFGLARAESGRARQLTNAVILAGNAAEAVSASDSPEMAAALLDEGGNVRLVGDIIEAGYNLDMSPSAEPGAALRVRASWETEDGGLVRSRVRVFAAGSEEPVYSLDTAVFLREVGE